MRTTLTINDALYRDLRRAALAAGTSLKEMVNRALRAGLEGSARTPRRRRFRGRTFRMGEPLVSLEKALALAGALEDEEVARKEALRK
jgi:hypothetical protein